MYCWCGHLLLEVCPQHMERLEVVLLLRVKITHTKAEGGNRKAQEHGASEELVHSPTLLFRCYLTLPQRLLMSSWERQLLPALHQLCLLPELVYSFWASGGLSVCIWEPSWYPNSPS